MPPVIYYLGGILVRATTKAIRDRLIAQGFRKATKGQINSTLPTVTGTENNLISLITRAKNAISGGKPAASGKPSASNNKLGGSGQSAIGRKLGSRRMANFGKVRGGKGRAEAMAKSKPVSARPGNFRTGKQDKVNPAVSPAATITGLVAAGAIGKVAYEAYVADKSPTVTQIKAAEKQIKAVAKDNLIQPSKDSSLVGTAGTEGKMQKARRIEAKKLEIKKRKAAELDAAKADSKRKDTPERKRRIDNTVRLAAIGGYSGLVKIREDADKKALTEVLNKKIASRKSTAAKEKAKARAGEYKSLASAKKAGSLYYMHKGKELRAAITRKETESASKRIRGEAMKKIGEGK